MGNAPSSSKPTTPSSSHAHSHSFSQSLDPPKAATPKRDHKSPIPVPNSRAAPPEPSLAQAKGSNSTQRSTRPLHHRPSGSTSLVSSSPSGSSPRGTTAAAGSLPAKHGHSQPVDVPPSSNADHHGPASAADPTRDPAAFPDALESAAIGAHTSSISDMSYLTRPPRLPLPIEEEVHTPGSPIITPADIAEPVGDDVDALDAAGAVSAEGLTRKTSVLSTGSDDDEDGVGEELPVDTTQPTVPTRLEWLRGGEKVYVTGTIFQWNRKTRLHPIEGRPGAFSATIHILPGTHHVRFLVDGQMQTSPDLPTTVDFGNNLVNYIEVGPDDAPPSAPEAGAAGAHAEQAMAAGPLSPEAQEEEEQPGRRPRGKLIRPKEDFSHQIPKYLIDFDQPEDSPHYNRAVTAIERLPRPPSLPGFLGKPILNAAVLIKDDNSVLNMPNHTVLNHLATSSIKNNVLAVSATTRYKHKYVTSIIYKPTSTED